MRPICSEFESILLEFFFLFTLYLITCINMRSPQAASSYITVKQSKLLSLWWAIVIMLYLYIWVVTGLLHLLVFRRTNVTNCASVDYSRLRSFILVHSQFLKKNVVHTSYRCKAPVAVSRFWSTITHEYKKFSYFKFIVDTRRPSFFIVGSLGNS